MSLAGSTPEQERVFLLHGLARSAAPMKKLARALRAAGYAATNLGYPSTTATVEALVESHLVPAMDRVLAGRAAKIHFIAHSMGGILVRQYLATQVLPQLGRVVMLGVPNRGSELVDRLGSYAPFHWINGPAGRQLGTGPDSLPNRLGAVTYPVGVIAGTRSYNPFYSALIEGPDDGKVGVERAKLEGMRDFLVLPVNHTFMMQNDEVIRQSLCFLREERFDRAAP